MFVLVVDTSFMNVSISAVVKDLHTTASGVQLGDRPGGFGFGRLHPSIKLEEWVTRTWFQSVPT